MAKKSKSSGMLNSDMSAIANMPQAVKYTTWPKNMSYADWNLDDTIMGIDKQMAADGSQMKRQKSNQKY